MTDQSIMMSFAYLVIGVIGIAAFALIALFAILWYDEYRSRKGRGL